MMEYVARARGVLVWLGLALFALLAIGFFALGDPLGGFTACGAAAGGLYIEMLYVTERQVNS